MRNCLIMATHNDGERSCNLDHVDVQCQVAGRVPRTVISRVRRVDVAVHQLQDAEAHADEEDM